MKEIRVNEEYQKELVKELVGNRRGRERNNFSSFQGKLAY
jgi:hypothetical protein